MASLFKVSVDRDIACMKFNFLVSLIASQKNRKFYVCTSLSLFYFGWHVCIITRPQVCLRGIEESYLSL